MQHLTSGLISTNPIRYQYRTLSDTFGSVIISSLSVIYQVILNDKMTPEINVHPLTNKPTEVWKVLSKTQKTLKLNVKIPSKPVEPNKVRFVCMSDTHSLIRNLIFDVPDGDVFIHAGDFTKCGQKEEVVQFNNWLGMKKNSSYKNSHVDEQ